MMRLTLLAPALLLSACATTAAPPEEPAAQLIGAGECKGEGLARFTGRQATQELAAEMLKVSGARTLRWGQPGMAMTMDYRTDRLTVHLDARNVVERANCG